MAEDTIINIPTIVLRWSDWTSWDSLKVDARGGGGVRVPNKTSGVYEVKYADSEERLTIGKAADLGMRVKQGLVKGKVPHSAGTGMRAHEEVSNIVVRWAITYRPAAIEEELHKRYVERFGKLPKYVEHT